jgi:uncharacterized Zn finger protein
MKRIAITCKSCGRNDFKADLRMYATKRNEMALTCNHCRITLNFRIGDEK